MALDRQIKFHCIVFVNNTSGCEVASMKSFFLICEMFQLNDVAL